MSGMRGGRTGRRATELVVFAALSLGLHGAGAALAVLGPESGGGGAASGGGGGGGSGAAGEIAAPSADLAALIEAWDTPPDAAEPDAPTPPAPAAPPETLAMRSPEAAPVTPPDAPATPETPAEAAPVPDAPRPEAAPPRAPSPAPSFDLAAPVPPPKPEPEPEPEPEAQPDPPQDTAAAPAAATPPARRPPPPAAKPAREPEPERQVAKAPAPAAKPSPKPAEKPARQAAAAPASAGGDGRPPGAAGAPDGGAGTAGSATQGDGASQDAGLRRSLILEWGARIRAEIERRKAYPSVARRRGVEGVARIALTVERDGRLSAARVDGGSGAAALDDAALAAVQAVGRFPGAPEALAGPRFAFVIPVSFRLR
ncbi:MAG: energy transducer TonB [Pseudomonadota bacterium]|nr:energy transducer TonB [Pseudomonadota bacterium]